MGSTNGNNKLCCLKSVIWLLKLNLVNIPSFVKGREIGKTVNSDIPLIKFSFLLNFTNLTLPNNHLSYDISQVFAS